MIKVQFLMSKTQIDTPNVSETGPNLDRQTKRHKETNIHTDTEFHRTKTAGGGYDLGFGRKKGIVLEFWTCGEKIEKESYVLQELYLEGQLINGFGSPCSCHHVRLRHTGFTWMEHTRVTDQKPSLFDSKLELYNSSNP
ncbi:hypothetical protein RHGRI_022195 [Rhododendron griersonianum]|uniref:Uncharacterized protein n=1 Tax=Rhododendron griersonianum TaxID=479676 RepID=A0AAV6JSS2_9ERIC|nr:hypothetical protein RHGRI_022195 [Rhododendron griersonianum]